MVELYYATIIIMDQKTAKKELIVIAILFVLGFIFYFFAPEKYKFQYSDPNSVGKTMVIIEKILAPIIMGWIFSGIYATWKLIGIIWRYLIEKTNRIWITSGFLFFIGVIIKLFLSIQFSVLGFPIYAIYCLKKKR